MVVVIGIIFVLYEYVGKGMDESAFYGFIYSCTFFSANYLDRELFLHKSKEHSSAKYLERHRLFV